MPAARALDDLPIATVKPAPHAAARRLHLRGLSQCRRLGRHAQHPGDHARPCSASPASSTSRSQRIKAELLPQFPERRRRRRPRAHLRLRRRDRRARRDDPDPHAAQHQPESELRRRGDGGEPRLREAAARAPAAAGHDPDRRRAQRRRRRRQRRRELDVVVPAGRGARRLHVDDRVDHAPGRGAPRAARTPPARDRAGERARRRRAVRRQRCVLRRHRQSGGRLLHRPAGARRRDGDVLRGHRGARRHRPADRARGDARGGRRR